MVQPTLAPHLQKTLERPGRTVPLRRTCQDRKSLERNRQSSLRSHGQYSQKPLLLNYPQGSSKDGQALRVQGQHSKDEEPEALSPDLLPRDIAEFVDLLG